MRFPCYLSTTDAIYSPKSSKSATSTRCWLSKCKPTNKRLTPRSQNLMSPERLTELLLKLLNQIKKFLPISADAKTLCLRFTQLTNDWCYAWTSFSPTFSLRKHTQPHSLAEFLLNMSNLAVHSSVTSSNNPSQDSLSLIWNLLFMQQLTRQTKLTWLLKIRKV